MGAVIVTDMHSSDHGDGLCLALSYDLIIHILICELVVQCATFPEICWYSN